MLNYKDYINPRPVLNAHGIYTDVKTGTMIQHIIGRLGYQNESDHFVPEFFNGVVPY